MAQLITQVTEKIKLNNNIITSVNQNTISGINQVVKRIDTISTSFSGKGIEIIKFVDSESEQTAGSFVKSDVKYVRITNLDSTNYVEIYLIASEDEEVLFKLDAGKTFMVGNAEFDASGDDDIVVVGYVDITYFSNLVKYDTIKAKANTSDVSIEYLVASS